MKSRRAPRAERQSGPTTFFGARRVPEAVKASLVRDVFAGVAPRYDLMNDLMSGGIHRLWKAEMVDWLNPRPGMALADIAGGTGDIAFRVLERLRDANATVTVIDASAAMLEVGRDRALDRGIVRSVRFVGGDAENLPLPDASQDACTNAFGLRNVTHMDAALAEVARVLRWGGRFLCLEFGRPVATGLEAAYDLYSQAVLPRLGQWVAGRGDAYQYLVDSIRNFPPRASVVAAMERAGLARVRTRALAGGIATLYSAWRI
jgi:demethylmenaquinone methyltransferase/2-methoxy-6-polyprenyl-1,4-benzoquinol methylase